MSDEEEAALGDGIPSVRWVFGARPQASVGVGHSKGLMAPCEPNADCVVDMPFVRELLKTLPPEHRLHLFIRDVYWHVTAKLKVAEIPQEFLVLHDNVLEVPIDTLKRLCRENNCTFGELDWELIDDAHTPAFNRHVCKVLEAYGIAKMHPACKDLKMALYLSVSLGQDAAEALRKMGFEGVYQRDEVKQLLSKSLFAVYKAVALLRFVGDPANGVAPTRAEWVREGQKCADSLAQEDSRPSQIAYLLTDKNKRHNPGSRHIGSLNKRLTVLHNVESMVMGLDENALLSFLLGLYQ
jgi:hypothetical protein